MTRKIITLSTIVFLLTMENGFSQFSVYSDFRLVKNDDDKTLREFQTGAGIERYFSKIFSLLLGIKFIYNNYTYHFPIDTTSRLKLNVAGNLEIIETNCFCYSKEFSQRTISAPLQINYAFIKKKKFSSSILSGTEISIPIIWRQRQIKYHINPFDSSSYVVDYRYKDYGSLNFFFGIESGYKITSKFQLAIDAVYNHPLLDFKYFLTERHHSFALGLKANYFLKEK